MPKSILWIPYGDEFVHTHTPCLVATRQLLTFREIKFSTTPPIIRLRVTQTIENPCREIQGRHHVDCQLTARSFFA
jgi:hypothetical protein